MSDDLPKKQFKSQSVNSLFRQQAANASESTKTLRKSRSPTPTTKVKLVSRRKVPAKRTSPTPPASTPPPVATPSTSTAASTETLSSTTNDKEQQPTPTSTTPPLATSDHESQTRQLQEGLKASIIAEAQRPHSSSQSSISQVSSDPLQVSFSGQRNLDWADDEWSDIQSQISSHTNSPHLAPKSSGRRQSERLATYSPEGTRSWSSPNSKISSFRRSVAAPMIHSLSQSPLSKPVDAPFPDPAVNRTPMGLFGERLPSRLSETKSNTAMVSQMEDDRFKSPNIWNTEERTKSDSAVPWAPFDIETLSLDDPFKMQYSQTPFPYDALQRNSSQSQSQSRNGSQTSRFFPSPIVEQNPSFDHFPRQPSMVERSSQHMQMAPQVVPQSVQMGPPQFNLFQQTHIQSSVSPQGDFSFQGRQLFQDTSAMASPLERPTSNPFPTPTTLKNSTQQMDHEVYPESFNVDLSHIPVSLPFPPQQEQTYTHPYHRRLVSYEQQAYPEGFSSTFYKRGSNNFMFIRELQPKLVTSKNRETVEVRVSFPSTTVEEGDDDDAVIKMRCHIVNVDVKELEGRIAGVKVAKNGPNTNRSRGYGRGYRSNGRR